MTRISPDLRARLLLSAQRAFLGEIPSNLRAVVLDVILPRVMVRCYVDGSTEGVTEDLWSVGTEMLADFDPNLEIRVDVIRLDSPNPVPEGGLWVFSRKEV